MNAEKWLIEVRRLDDLINDKLAERDRLVALATDTSAKMPDGMPFNNTGVVPQKMQDATLDIILLDREIDKLIDRFVNYKETVISTLLKLPEKEYLVLYKHYIEYKAWVKVAVEMDYSRMQIWRIEKKALKNLEKFLKNT